MVEKEYGFSILYVIVGVALATIIGVVSYKNIGSGYSNANKGIVFNNCAEFISSWESVINNGGYENNIINSLMDKTKITVNDSEIKHNIDYNTNKKIAKCVNEVNKQYKFNKDMQFKDSKYLINKDNSEYEIYTSVRRVKIKDECKDISVIFIGNKGKDGEIFTDDDYMQAELVYRGNKMRIANKTYSGYSGYGFIEYIDIKNSESWWEYTDNCIERVVQLGYIQ